MRSYWFQACAAALFIVMAMASCKSTKLPPLADFGGDDVDSGPPVTACGTLEQQEDAGTSLGLTAVATVYGTALDPAGRNGLYNVSVYIPRPGALPALSKGVSCDRCGSTITNPIASTLSDESGAFKLTNVPLGNQSLVIQVGKWRKVVPINVNSTCFSAGNLTLPKNGSEGDMPQVAITTGALDALECLIRNFGVDESEFVPGPGGTGHMHLFNGYGGNGPPGTPDAQTGLWNDATQLADYDIAAFSCEGAEHDENKTNMQAIHDYVEAGGRFFGTHFHYTWLKNSPQPDFQSVATWANALGTPAAASYNVNETFPKGKSFAEWLVNQGASTSEGSIPLDNVTNSVLGINAATSTDWIDQNANDVKYFTFNAPIAAAPAAQCGRVVFSDIHVFPAGGEQWPTGCGPVADLTPQQKALEFLFFDLSSCVQSDAQQPSPVK